MRYDDCEMEPSAEAPLYDEYSEMYFTGDSPHAALMSADLESKKQLVTRLKEALDFSDDADLLGFDFASASDITAKEAIKQALYDEEDVDNCVYKVITSSSSDHLNFDVSLYSSDIYEFLDKEGIDATWISSNLLAPLVKLYDKFSAADRKACEDQEEYDRNRDQEEYARLYKKFNGCKPVLPLASESLT